MSVDLGKARTGVALCDEGERMAFPKTVIHEYNTEKLIEKLADCAKQSGARLVVVGLPVNMDGSAGERAAECAAIADRLETVSGIKTELFDERCTTMQAHQLLNLTDTRGKRRKETVDAVAAVIILEDFLRRKKATGPSPDTP